MTQQAGFIFGAEGLPESPEELARLRKVADALRVRRSPQTVGEGLVSLGEGLASGLTGLYANRKEAKAKGAAMSQYQNVMDSIKTAQSSPKGFSITATPSTTIPAPASSGSNLTKTGETKPVTPSVSGSVPASASNEALQKVAKAMTSAGGSPAAPAVSGNRQSFIDALLPAAIEQSQRTGVDPRIIVSQAALETGWGRSAPGNNYFGIKSHGKGGGQTFTTHEVVNGKRVKIKDSFRQYATPGDSVRGYGDFLLANPRYKNLMAAEGLDNQIAALQESGYATDPNYGSKIAQIANTIQIPQAQVQAQTPVQVASADPAQAFSALLQPASAPQSAPQATPQASTQAAPENDRETIAKLLAQRNAQQPQQPVSEGMRKVAQAMQGMDQQTMGIVSALNNPFMPASQKAVLEALLKQRDPMRQMQLEKQRLEIEQMRNRPAPERQREKDAAGRLRYLDDGSYVFPDVQTPAGYQMLSPEQVKEMGLPEGAYQQGPKGRISKIGGGGTNVTVNNGPDVPAYNKLPAGYVYKRGPDGKILINSEGIPEAAPITGGPAALEAEKLAETQKAAQELKERGGNVVLEDIDRAMDIIDNGGFFNGTGFSGNLMSGIPGTDAFALNKLLDTVKANSGFDKLQQMRDASPTGGALGAVSERELNFLQSAIGSLDQAQDSKTLLHNLERVKRIYQEIVHGPGGQKPDNSNPQAGTIVDGYRFKGGDPSDQNNWERQ